jgi:hypothetical protein
MIKYVVSAIMSVFSSIFGALFGKVSWSTPPWINCIKRHIAAKPKAYAIAAVGVLVAIVAICYSYHWYNSRPQPERIITQIITPKITPAGDVLIPDVLTLNFGVMTNNELSVRSVAPLDMNGKKSLKALPSHPPSMAPGCGKATIN